MKKLSAIFMAFVLLFSGCQSAEPKTEEVSSAAEISSAVEASGVAETQTRLVFVTELHDTRFDEYGVLRPLSSAH